MIPYKEIYNTWSEFSVSIPIHLSAIYSAMLIFALGIHRSILSQSPDDSSLPKKMCVLIFISAVKSINRIQNKSLTAHTVYIHVQYVCMFI